MNNINNLQNVIFIAEFNHYKRWPGKSYYDLVTYVQKHTKNYKIHLFWTDDAKDRIIETIKTTSPSLIVFFITGCIKAECSNLMDIFQMKIPVACAMLDMFFPYYGKTDYTLPDALIHIGKNDGIVSCYQEIFPNKCVTSFSSRFINLCRFKDYKLEKKYDILIYGTRTYDYPFKKEELPAVQRFISAYEKEKNVCVEDDTLINFYYLRKRLETLIEKNQERYRVKILPKSGIYDATVANEDLSKLINQSHLTIACTTVCDVMMHKYLEISASKSVILGNIPSDYEDIFRGNIVEVTEFMSDNDILDKIDSALNNPEQLASMANRLYNEIREKHSIEHSVSNFEEVFQEICSEVNKKS